MEHNIGFYDALITIIVAGVTLILFFVFKNRWGIAWSLSVSLFYLDRVVPIGLWWWVWVSRFALAIAFITGAKLLADRFLSKSE